jgi:hypothetical protein
VPSVEKIRRNGDGSCWTRVQWYLGGIRQAPVTVHAENALALRREIDAEIGRLTSEIHLQKTRRGPDRAAVANALHCSGLVREWLRLYVAVELTGATRRAYADDAATLFCPFWDEFLLGEVGREQGLQWRAFLLERVRASGNSRLEGYEGAGYPRVNRVLTMGRSIFTFAVQNGWISEEQNPLRNVKDLPYIPPAESFDFVFEPELAEAIRLVIAQVKPQHRKNEVLQMESRVAISCLAYLVLTQQDLFDARFKQALNHDGTPRLYFEVPRRPSGSARKSQARKREILIPQQVQDEFVALWRARGCPPLDELIVPTAKGTSYTRQNWQRDFWRDALEAVRSLEIERVTGGPNLVAIQKGEPIMRPRFHDVPAGAGVGPHAARRCAVRMWAIAGHLEAEVVDALGHHQNNKDTLYRHYAKAKRETRDAQRRDRFVSLEEQIAHARAIYSSPAALAERDRVLAAARAEAKRAHARQKRGRGRAAEECGSEAAAPDEAAA